MEYNSSIWSPSSVGDIESVERVLQRCFTKRLHGLKTMSYDHHFKFLDVPSLSTKAIRADLYWCYKILLGLVAVTSDVFFTNNFCTSTRGPSTKFISIILQLVCVQTFLLNELSMSRTICPKASVLAHYPDSNERLNGFDLVILGFS